MQVLVGLEACFVIEAMLCVDDGAVPWMGDQLSMT
jgi:hypothetical protein